MYPHLPLAKRVARSSSKATSVVVPQVHGERGTYRTWDDIALQNAVAAVDKGMPYRQAAEMYGVPKSTVHDHLSGKIALGARPGPDPYLSIEEEEELASFLIETAKIGYPHTKRQVLAVVQEMVDAKKISTTISNGWWERFSKRHPKITLRAAVPLSLARAIASDGAVVSKYFDMLEECLRQNDIFDKPGNIFNCDETGLPLNPTCLKVVDKVGTKHPSYITSGSKSQITVLACTSATGYAIPPFVIYDRKTLNVKLTEGEVPGTLYGLSHNGWMNSDLFYHWFLRHFLEYVPRSRPLILLLDGHSSHYCPSTIRLAAENGIILFALPPHTTHITQPLDKGCFAPLKVVWRQVCHDFCSKNPGRTVSRYDFSRLFSKTWYKAMSAGNIVASFKVTGVYPFNRSAIKLPGAEEEMFSSFKPEGLGQKTGLAYIPLYTPSKTRQPRIPKVAANMAPVSPLFARHGTMSSSEEENGPLLDLSLPSDHSFDTSDHYSVPVPLRRATSVSNFLIPPLPPNKLPTQRGKSSGAVLTSDENMRMIEEREKRKVKEEEEKKERKLERERKAKLKKELKDRRPVKEGRKKDTQQSTLSFVCMYTQSRSLVHCLSSGSRVQVKYILLESVKILVVS